MDMDTARRATIISTGRELVSGRAVDSNAVFLARLLVENGFQVGRICILGDNPDDITSEIKAAAGRDGFVLITGGLGPTADDRTRGAVAEAVGMELVRRDEALRCLKRTLGRHGLDLCRRHIAQACTPGHGPVFENAVGTACGFCCHLQGTKVIAMPGVPQEMRTMFSGHVLPFMLGVLRRSALQDRVTASERGNVFGLPESKVNSLISDMMEPGRNPELGLCVEDGRIVISVVAGAVLEEEARALIEKDVLELRKRLGDAIYGYGDTTLAASLGALLKRGGWRVALAESCTGGLIGDMLVDVPGISESFLLDVVAYSNDAKKTLLGVKPESIDAYGAVSEEVAKEMACGVSRICGADLGLSTTGIAGPSGGSPSKPVGLVYVGVCFQGQSHSFQHNLRGDRRQIRHRAACYALNHLRRILFQDGA